MESIFRNHCGAEPPGDLSLLVSSQQSVGEIERQLGMPQPMVSKHLRVLREAVSWSPWWMHSAVLQAET